LQSLQEMKSYVTQEIPPTPSMLESGQNAFGDFYKRLPSNQEIRDAAWRWSHGDVSSSTVESSFSFDPLEADSDGPSLLPLQDPPLSHESPSLLDDISSFKHSLLSFFSSLSLPPYRPSMHSTQEFLRYNIQYSQTLLRIATDWAMDAPIWIRLSLLAVAFLIMWTILRRMWRVISSRNIFQRLRGGTAASGAGGRRRRNSKVLYAGGKSFTFQASGAILEEAPAARNRKNSFGRGVEILRSGGRGRFGTFDFFGMNDPPARRRDQSTDSYGDLLDNGTFHDSGGNRSRHNSRGGPGPVSVLGANGGTGNFRKERLGSMDVYLTEGAFVPSNNRKNTDMTPLSNGGLPGEPFLSSSAIIDDNGGERLLYDEFGIVTLSHRVVYYGPLRLAFESATYAPPTSWAEASRRIVPADIMTKLERRLRLDVLAGKLRISTPTSAGQRDAELALDKISMYVQRPLEGGVISLYVKGAPKEEWMEHTFKTAHAAAQFQLDLLAYQTLGKTVRHVFEALNMVHQGSLAYDGREYVLHDDHRVSDDEKDDCQKKSPKSVNVTRCVAWDDAMRAMSSIPTVRIALERLWLSHRRPSDISSAFQKKQKKEKGDEVNLGAASAAKDGSDVDIITEEYAKKRLLLGPLDFFRLFVPTLPEIAIPEGESNRGRMEQLLCWRKRVARAAVLVRAYSRARRVVNLGWHLHSPKSGEPSDDSIVKRLAYDGNEDNNVRDSAAKNEIYEASVSRDVLCYVRPFDFLSEDKDHRDDLVLSPYQAYSHVGSQYFKMTSEVIGAVRDPVEMFPSLRNIIAENPDLDFLVIGVRLQNKGAMKFDLYVRSLAKSIDPQFDCVVSAYKERLCFEAVSISRSISFYRWTVLRVDGGILGIGSYTS
jgi:hypothetical protein